MSRQPTAISHNLAGVEAVMKSATDFCLATFAVHASSSRIQGGKHPVSQRTFIVNGTHSTWSPCHWTPWIGQDFNSECCGEASARITSNLYLLVFNSSVWYSALTQFIDILHIDLAKYVDTPVAKIKTLFKHWLEKAQWHRPSVIVMDNMDKLMSPELEV